MIQLFVDRGEELRFLGERFSSAGPELVIICGRRRVGKTELVAKFMKGKSAVYFLADRRPERDLLDDLKEKNLTRKELRMQVHQVGECGLICEKPN